MAGNLCHSLGEYMERYDDDKYIYTLAAVGKSFCELITDGLPGSTSKDDYVLLIVGTLPEKATDKSSTFGGTIISKQGTYGCDSFFVVDIINIENINNTENSFEDNGNIYQRGDIIESGYIRYYKNYMVGIWNVLHSWDSLKRYIPNYGTYDIWDEKGELKQTIKTFDGRIFIARIEKMC